MDQFEASRAKYEKNLARKAKYLPEVQFAVEHEVKTTTVQEVSREKSPDAIIKVVISLPTKDIEFTLRKKNIASNATNSRMTKDEFRNAFIRGLEPLLGRVE